MLPAEAAWLGRAIDGLEAAAISPLCNVGSSTLRFRTVGQPWIEDAIFAPLRARRVAVTHLDLRAGPGIDVVGDLARPETLAALGSAGFGAVMCCNVLEHVTHPGAVAAAAVDLVRPGGYVIASCPRDYPYHADPLDNGLRPLPAELAALFPGCDLVDRAEVRAGTYLSTAVRHPLDNLRFQAWSLVPFGGGERTRSARAHLRWLRRPFSATCVVLRRR